MESISIREAAERLGVSHKVIRRLIAQGLVAARKVTGAHGVEWSVDALSLEAYRSGPLRAPREHTTARPRPRKPSVHAAPDTSHSILHSAGPGFLPDGGVLPFEALDALREDRRFLREHLAQLTALLREAIMQSGARTVPPAGIPVAFGLGGQAGKAGQAGPGGNNGEGYPGEALPYPEAASAAGPTLPVRQVTEALQSSLRSIETGEIAALEMCSVKVLWGKPVLWRVVAEHPDDVAALLDAILSPDTAWVPPDEEVHFLWARNKAGEVVWGTACGAGWFGEPFPEALRTARIERR